MRTHTAVLALAALLAAMATAQPPDKPGWKDVDRLISEDKYEAASSLVSAIRARAQADGDAREWTRALIEESLLRTALHGYETAVRFLKDEPWPPAPRYRLVLELFYAQSLTTYVQGYSWEIRQRERVTSTDEVDLKAWTLDQIYGEAQRAYLRVWAERDAWDDGSLGDLAELFVGGNYPAPVRGTLRDAVTYLYVELLADSSLWRPEHANEVFRLQLEDLLTAAAAVDLDDPDVHPLAKIAAVLGDLESWHRRGERPEAALEARLERLRRLWASFDQDDDRVAMRGDLTAHLHELGRRYPWWSMGMATLAEFLRDGDAPDRLQRARKIALDGEQAHPDSPGGQRCRHIAAVIEQPAFGVAAMATDGPGQRSLKISHKNLPALHFRAYALDLAATAEGARDYNLLPDYRAAAAILERRRPDAEWTVELPQTPDFLDHDTYVTPPLETPSLYLIVASARRDFAADANQRTALPLIVSDLVLVRDDFEAPVVTVRSGRTGEALPGVAVSLYRYDWQQGHAKVGTTVTDAAGNAGFKSTSPREQYFVIARRGAEVALLQSLYVAQPQQQQPNDRALVYTDRSIYRPGQTIRWKAVAYRRHAERGRFETLDDTQLTVTLRDANNQEVASAAVTTNSFGTASGDFAIPPGRLLGQWRIETSIPGGASVRVEEYKRPTFEVTVDEPAAPLRLNRPATLGGEVRYYFGLPVASGDVVWRVTREPVWTWWWFREPPAAGAQTIAAGTATLGGDGRFNVTFTPEADERLAADKVTYRYRLTVDVTDDGGETRSASRAFRLGFVAVEAQVVDAPGFFDAGSAPALTLKRQDLDGAPRAGSGRWRLVELAQPKTPQLPAELPAGKADGDKGFHTPGDLLRPRWDSGSYTPRAVLRDWDDGAERAQGDVEHDGQGQARLALPKLGAGAYRLRYATDDAFGATFETAYEFLVIGKDDETPLALAALLEVERASVPVGGVVRLAVHSGFAGQQMALVVDRGGRRESRRLASRPGVQLLEIPVGRDGRGGLGVSLAVLRDHQLMTLRQSVFVPWDDRELQVELATFRDKMRPGESETWTVTVKSADGKALAAGAAELLAYMYDRSLDLFAPHQPFDPLTLYPSSVYPPGAQSNLGQASQVWGDSRGFAPVPGYPALMGDRLKSYDGYGLGGPGRRRGDITFRGGSPRVMRMAAVPEAAPLAESAEDSGLLQKAETLAAAVPQPPSPPPPPEAGGEPAPRSDFSETAFWQPHLVLGDGGAVAFEFTVPESLTEWNVWVHALTRDLKAGHLERQVKTVKELLVRPYLPRFLRQGDRAEIRVLVQNAGDKDLAGTLDFDVRDPETEASLLADFGLAAADVHGRPFTVAPGGSAELTFPVAAPARLGTVAFTAVARAGDWSDGELRPLPVLPSRVSLAQSRFVTLRDRDRRTLAFDDLARGGDPTRHNELLVVTLDAQLFYGVLNALPYLVNYPYECTEQTLNRFLSTGIVSSLYDEYPAVARMARQLSTRETRFEPWDAADPNRKMTLEETPWLVTAHGGDEPAEDLVNVLDPKIAAAQRAASLEKLRQAQTAIGGFPWWPGGPPSPYMTLYLLDGFSRALEFNVEVPQDVVVRAWSYLHSHYVDEIARRMVAEDCCWETVTYLNYVLSSYPDPSWTGDVFTADDREKMLEHSLDHWQRHSPRLKAYLALTLHRMGRDDEARKVFDSILDSAKTTRDEGTYWAPEDRSWLWYNDTIESHAFVLRALLELAPDDALRHGLVQWLFLNKQLNHWKSTRATAEVIYSLIHYLEREGTLGAREEATVTLGPRTEAFTWEPDRYTGKDTRIVVAGEDVEPSMGTIEVSKETPGFLFASATWHFSTERLPEKAEGDFFAVERRYFRRVHDGREWTLEPLAAGAEIAVGDQLEVQLSLRAKHAAEYVHLRDPRGAGFEPETLTSRHQWDLGILWYEEVRDSGTNFFFEWLPMGEYTFKYRLRANVAGTFRVGPATVQSMYAPELVAYSSGAELGIVP